MTTELQEPEMTEAEIYAMRREINDEARKGREHLKAIVANVSAPATVYDLIAAMAVLRGYATNFAIAHVAKRAVLRDDVPEGQRAVASQWAGVYAVDKAYNEGAFVVHANSLWIAKMATAAKPGAAEGGWALVCKSPR